MATYGLTSTGLSLPRTADLREEIRTAYNRALSDAGLPTISDDDWDNDLILSLLVDIPAQKLDEILQYVPDIYNARVPGNATDVQLDDLGTIVGTPRNKATASTATVTITGTAGEIVLAGFTVEGGGEDGRARWTLDDDTTIGGGGTVDGSFTCTETGATTADPGDIDAIVTPRAGVTSVTNAAAAVVGSAIESDADYRARRQASLVSTEGSSAASLRAQLLDLDYMEGVYIIDNDDTAPLTVGALTVPGCAVAPILWPNTLTSAQEDEVAAVMYRYTGGGQVYGTDVTKSVASDGVTTKVVGFTYASQVTVNAATTVTLDTGYSLGDVESAVQTAISTYIGGLSVGEAVRLLDVYDAIAAVEGVAEAGVLLNGSAAGVAIGNTEIAAIGTNTVTT